MQGMSGSQRPTQPRGTMVGGGAAGDDREERSLGIGVEARRAAGGCGGMSRIGKIRNPPFLI